MPEVLYGISNGFGTVAANQIYKIDPITGTVSDAVTVTLTGFTVKNGLALAGRQSDKVLFAVLQVASRGPPGERHLVTIDPVTGVATDIGILTDAISSLAFGPAPADILYGVVGTGGTFPGRLYTINTSTAGLTFLLQLTKSITSGPLDGHVIAYDYDNDFLYHSTGANGDGGAILEKVNVVTPAIVATYTQLPDNLEAYAMGYSTNIGKMFLSDSNNDLFTVDLTDGTRTLVNSIATLPDGSYNRGLVFFSSQIPCLYHDTLVHVPSGRRFIRDIKAGDTVIDHQGNPVIVEYNMLFSATKTFIRIPKGSLGKNTPTNTVYIRKGHPILIGSKEVLPETLALENSSVIETKLRKKSIVYSLCTKERTFVKMNGLDVATWAKDDWEKRAKKMHVVWSKK